jgi:proline dehydrogenase
MNARFTGAYRDFCEKLSLNEFFQQHKVFSTTDWRRMRDLDFCVILTTTLLSTYYHRGMCNEEYLKRYNDEFAEGGDLSNQIDETLAFIENCNFDKQCRVWKKTDLFTLIVEIHSQLRNKCVLDPEKVKAVLVDFYSQVDTEAKLKRTNEDSVEKKQHSDVRRYVKASNDKYARVDRAEIIAEILQETLQAKTVKSSTKKAPKKK